MTAALAGLQGRAYLLMLGFLEADCYIAQKAELHAQLTLPVQLVSTNLVARADWLAARIRLVSDEEWLCGGLERGNCLRWDGEGVPA